MLTRTADASTTTLETTGAQGEAPRRRTRRTPLTHQQQDLAASYVPMAKSLAKPMKRCWPREGDEFESAALTALVEAAQSFDPSRNVKFSTFARHRIWGALRDVQRSLITAGWRADIENAPVIGSLPYEAEEKGRVLNVEPDPPVGRDMEASEFVERSLRKLPMRHAAACQAMYVDGLSQGEAAERLCCSKSRLSYLHKESIQLLREAWRHEVRSTSLTHLDMKTL